MNEFVFQLSTKVKFGCGVSEDFGNILADLGIENVMVVTDKGIVEAGLLNKIKNEYADNGLNFTIFDEVESDPSVATISRGVRIARENNIEGILAIGGGSPIDCAKGICVLTTNGGTMREYAGVGKIKKPPLPLVALPTTSGTGSEVTKFAVITDRKEDRKFTVVGDLMAPNVALVDPEMTISLPEKITAATGMDALTHAIESYVSLKSQPPADALALRAIKLIKDNLRPAVANGEDIEARENMLLASLIAGMSFNNGLLGLSHAIASPLGGHFHITHGIANTIMLPYVIDYNVISNVDKFAKITELFRGSIEDLTKYEAAQKAAEEVKKLAEDINMPTKLREAGAKKDKLVSVAEDALKSGMLKVNPRKAGKEQILELLKKAY